jgi:hypothetical protein
LENSSFYWISVAKKVKSFLKKTIKIKQLTII